MILLGIVQGLTEFLPVSSSGHLALLENIPYFQKYTASLEKHISLLGFNVILHLGTLLAVLYFYRKDIFSITKAFFTGLKNIVQKKENTHKEFNVALLIIVATLPVLIVPFIKDFVDSSVHNLSIIGIAFIINGIILMVSELLLRKKKTIAIDSSDLVWYKALLIGIMQVFAVFPGISRSGSTISGGLMNGLKAPEAVRFSFLMSIPVLTAAVLLEGKEALEKGGSIDISLFGIGMFFSFLTGMLSLSLLVYLSKKLILYPFGIYTLVLGFFCFWI